jgi:hypothetical protein
MNYRIAPATALALAFVICHSSFVTAQGPLTPPGGPAPLMKTLDQVEPRIPIATNTTPGDGGAQFVITNAGSYYLTENISGVGGKDGISIRSDNVTLDLNGFAMVGLNGGFSGSAIIVPGAFKNLCVRNGTIQGWGSTALLFFNAKASRLERLQVSDSGGSGIYAGNDFTVSDCTSVSNGVYGIFVGIGSRVDGCIASYSQTGISAGDKSSIASSTCVANSAGGILAGDKVLLTGCTCTESGGYGIGLGDDCSASRCAGMNNGNTGIVAGKNGTFNDCRASRNTASGFQVGDGAALTGCSADNNLLTDGMLCGEAATVQNCSSGYNGRHGFTAGKGSSLNNCSARNNTSEGFHVNYGVTLTGCTAAENVSHGFVAAASALIQNCNADANTGDGIRVFASSRVLDCSVSANGSTTNAGIHVTGGYNRIENNHLTFNANTGLKVDNGAVGNFIVRNSATQNATAYSIAAGNRDAQVLAGGSGFISTDPWANYAY